MRIQRRSEIAFLTVFGSVFLLFFLQSANAQKLPKPLFKTAPAERKILVEEIKHEYYVRKYSPPVKVKFVKKKEKCSYPSPEETIIAQISAMAALDQEWALNCFDEESRKFTVAFHKSQNVTPGFIEKKWREAFKGRRFELITRVDSRGGVIIEYTAISQSKAAEDKVRTLSNSLKKQPDGTWKRTQEFRAHVVDLWWRAPEEKVERTISYELP